MKFPNSTISDWRSPFLHSYFFIFVLSLLLASCGGSSSSSSIHSLDPAPSNSSHALSPARSTPLEDYGRILCDQKKGTCDLGIVGILNWKGHPGEQLESACSGFLTPDGLVITAGHCVPEETLRTGDCSDQMSFLVPVPFDNEVSPVLACDRVVSSSNPVEISSMTGSLKDMSKYPATLFKGGVGADFAVIKTKSFLKSRRWAVPFSAFFGFPFGETFKLGAVDFSWDEFKTSIYTKVKGEVVMRACQTVSSSYFSLAYDSAGSGEVGFGGCLVRKGNSGGPVFDSDMKWKGIISRAFTPNSLAEVRKTYPIFRFDEKFGLARATNGSCLNWSRINDLLLKGESEVLSPSNVNPAAFDTAWIHWGHCLDSYQMLGNPLFEEEILNQRTERHRTAVALITDEIFKSVENSLEAYLSRHPAPWVKNFQWGVTWGVTAGGSEKPSDFNIFYAIPECYISKAGIREDQAYSFKLDPFRFVFEVGSDLSLKPTVEFLDPVSLSYVFDLPGVLSETMDVEINNLDKEVLELTLGPCPKPAKPFISREFFNDVQKQLKKRLQ